MIIVVIVTKTESNILWSHSSVNLYPQESGDRFVPVFPITRRTRRTRKGYKKDEKGEEGEEECIPRLSVFSWPINFQSNRSNCLALLMAERHY